MNVRALVCLWICLVFASAASAGCPVFTIERDASGLHVAREMIEEGAVLVFTRDLSAGTVDLVLPTGPGRSAGLLRATDADRIVVRFAGGKLSGQLRRVDGSTMELPSRTLAELKREDIRVSVTLGDTLRRSFFISGYESAEPDDVGPAENMFAGQLPEALTHDAAIVQTSTWTRPSGPPVSGRIALERNRWLFARGSLKDGRSGWFVMDLGASESILAKQAVPVGVTVEPLSMTERSAAGTRRLPYAPAGATGRVSGVLGHATLTSLEFDTVAWPGADVTVLDSIPDVFGRPVLGILGLDLLRRGTVVTLQLEGSERASLTFTSASSRSQPTAETPFSWVASHVMVRGAVEGRPARWILDSGSPGTVLDAVGAPPGPASGAAAAGTLGGIDGGSMRSEARSGGSLAVGSAKLTGVGYRVAPLTAFASLREPGVALGVLGVSELARFGCVELDFGQRKVRWYR